MVTGNSTSTATEQTIARPCRRVLATRAAFFAFVAAYCATLETSVPVAAQVLIPGPNAITGSTTLSGTLQGNNGPGYFVANGGTLVVNNGLLENFTTTGGAGSNGGGGGAGFGGAIFIDNGGTAILNNTSFSHDAAVGGTGGGTTTAPGSVFGAGGVLNNGIVNGYFVGIANGAAGTTPPAAQDNGVIFGGGEGNGFPGGTGTGGGPAISGFGGAGGAGQFGTPGWSTNPIAISNVSIAAQAVGAATATVASLLEQIAAAAANPATTPLAPGFTAQEIAAALALTGATQTQIQTALILADWNAAAANGTVAIGGNGGNGGTGGAGSYGFGGGPGGNGAVGGAGGTSGASEGNSGSGGVGGVGGFGGGGGAGGFGVSNTGDSNEGLPGVGGAGGAAGFGGGVGSTGGVISVNTPSGCGGVGINSGSNPYCPTPGVGGAASAAFGAGGGDGYGGAIFVNSTGTLVLTGNSTFSGNNAYGGSSLDGGVAGGGAGTDLFMMTGATVQIAPGTGNVITFNGTIADNSISSIGAANSVGTGASLTTYAGLTVFNGANTYSGQTIINGGALTGPLNVGSNTALNYGITAGALQATDGVGLPTNSLLNFAGPNQFTGGVLQTNGLFDRWVGVFDPTNEGVASRVEWTGSGGFAAVNGPLTVMLDSGAPLVWGSNSFVPFGSSLMFGSANSTDLVTFTNAVNISGGTASILVVNNGDPNSVAAMTGVISGSGALSVGGGGYDGTLFLTGANTYTGGTTVTSASLAINSDAALGAPSGALNLNNGVLIATANITSARTITLTGPSNVIDTNMNSVSLSGNISGAGALMTSGAGSLNLGGTDTYTGGTFVGPGTTLTTTGPTVLPAGGPLVVVSPSGVQTNVFTGTVNVSGPLDLVNGQPPELFVQPGETLQGVGSVNVAVVVEGGGGNQPGDGPGTIVVNAPVTDLAGSTYTVAIDGPLSSVGCANPSGCAGTYSSTIVTGAGNTYTAAGTLAPLLRGISAPANNNYTPPVTTKFVIVQAAGGVLGSFSGLTQPSAGLAAGTRFDVLYGPNGSTPYVNSNAITLYVTPADYTNLTSFSVNLTANQTEVGAALNALRGPAGPSNNLPATIDLGALYMQQPSALPHDFDTLSGEANADAVHGAFEMMSQFLELMVDPAVIGRGGNVGGAALGFAPDDHETLPSTLTTAFDSLGLPAKTPPPSAIAFEQRWSAWGASYGGASVISGDPVIGTHDLTAAAYGFAGGLDYHFTPEFMAGFAVGGGGTNWGVSQGLGGGRSAAFQAGLYSKASFGQAYVAAALAFANQWMTTDRYAFTGDHLGADFSAQSYGARLETGYRYAMPWFGVTPYGAFQAQAFHTPNYDETDFTGGVFGLFGLNYNAATTTDLSGEIGARFDHLMSLDNGMQLDWRGRAAWEHDWVNNPALTATFQAALAPGALPGAPVGFNVNGAALPHNSALISAGADLHLTNSITVGAKFDGAIAASTQTYAGTATLRYAW